MPQISPKYRTVSPVVTQQTKLSYTVVTLPGVVSQPIARPQTKLSNSPVTCLVLSHSLSHDNKQNCRTVLLLCLVLSHSLSYDHKPNCPTALLPAWCCPTACRTTTNKTVQQSCYSAWCCPTACRTSTNQTVQQSCYLPGAVPQPVVHQPTKLSNSPVTCLVLSHSLSYINQPNCPTVLLPAWCCPTACRTSTNQTVQQSCYLPGAVPQPVVHQRTKLSNSLVTCLVLSHSLSYINQPNCPTVLLPAWCCPTACRTSTNQTVQQSCYLPGAVPQPVVHQQTKLSNSPVTCLVLSHSLSYINKQTVQQSCYLPGAVPQPVVHQQTKLSNSLVTCLVLSHSLSYVNKQNCPTVLLPAWCCPTTCRTSTNKTVQQSCYFPGVVQQPVAYINKPNCPTVLLLAWCCPTACRTSTNKTVQQSCYLPGVVPQPVVHQQTKLSNSPVTCLVLSHNPSYINKQNCPIVLLLTWGCPTTCRYINKQNCPTVLLLTWGCPTTCRMTTTNKTVQQSCYLPGVVPQPVA
uniref:Uncharacterized protein n=1 Tax=Branchiostoma floridae TaxID=7739 RepID=C3ZS75_BRAFL|eukprot:XP_002588596.1 hypothetical protein BRAFLDRAFT_107523 [Branchiostoma floridae]